MGIFASRLVRYTSDSDVEEDHSVVATLVHAERRVQVTLPHPMEPEHDIVGRVQAALPAPDGHVFAGFFVDENMGGPLCTPGLLVGVPSPSDTVKPLFIPAAEAMTYLGPLPPAPLPDITWADVAAAAAAPDLPASRTLSHVLAERLAQEGFVRLDLGPAGAAAAERAFHSAHAFMALPRAAKSRHALPAGRLRDGKLAGYVNNGAREFFQVQRRGGGRSGSTVELPLCLVLCLYITAAQVRTLTRGLPWPSPEAQEAWAALFDLQARRRHVGGGENGCSDVAPPPHTHTHTHTPPPAHSEWRRACPPRCPLPRAAAGRCRCGRPPRRPPPAATAAAGSGCGRCPCPCPRRRSSSRCRSGSLQCCGAWLRAPRFKAAAAGRGGAWGEGRHVAGHADESYSREGHRRRRRRCRYSCCCPPPCRRRRRLC